MATPTLDLFRLPSEAEARKILKEASTVLGGSPLDTPQGKARRNLYKGIDWAYKGLPPTQKPTANAAYQQLSRIPTADLAIDFVNEKGALNADRVVAAIKALTQTEAKISHSGHDRLQKLTDTELTAIDQALLAIDTHIKEIQAGTHNAHIDRIFPHDASVPELQNVADVRTRVLLTFTKGFEAVKEYRRECWKPWAWKSANLKVDTYSGAIHAGGLTSREEMKLAPSFFTKALNKQEADLLHESTHAIKEETYRTTDEGGYIGSAKFEAALLSERLKNAAHYEAVIRLINGEVLAIPDNAARDPEALKAQETLRKAWDKALNLYGWVHGLGSGTITSKDDLLGLRDVCWLFGLGGYQGLAGTEDAKLPARSVTLADLAAFENRVGKLGSMMGSVNVGAAVDDLTLHGIALTERAILLKVIEQKGTIRKTTDAVKTLDMIDVLANFGKPKVDAFQLKYPLK